MSSPQPRLRALIFDVDGTLADTVPICIEAFRRTVSRYGGPSLDASQVVALFGPTEEGMLQRVLAERWESALGAYLATYAELHGAVRQPFEGLADTLARLRQAGARLAIVTGKGARTTALSCRFLGLEGVFDPVETGSDAGPAKDRGIRSVLERWRLPAAEVAYVGDAVADVRAARAVGVAALAAAWSPSADSEALAGETPDALFRSVADFSDWATASLRDRSA